ncbi:MAG: DUF721 domain-containing protein [Deltaproteobacteria bacterium]|nr:DUF721 domain-containing protein [Deltaproteobacteria bacterium]
MRPWRHRRSEKERYRPRRGPERAGALLARWVKDQHLDHELEQHELLARWPELVGERVASRTEPGSVRDGQLTVTVSSSAWLNELSFLKTELATRINATLGRTLVKGIRLVVGKVRPPAPPRQPAAVREPPAPPTPEEARAVDEAVAPVADPVLRQALAAARLADLRRGRPKGEG